jgi:N-succinyldiaminopimelate aminotransferase
MNSQVTVTNGATEAIFSTCMALINPGDEVIVLEPFYDSYLAAIRLAGGVPVPVTLKAPDFSFDLKELEAAFTDKTKMIFFNSPHNPTGKVFSKEEMNSISQLVIKHDTYLVSDEVYEFLTFEGLKHLPIATLEGMKERVITISSAGKTFGLTGWKIGWITASEALTHAIRMVHQFNTFSVCTPLQFAVAEALTKLETYVPEFKAQYGELRSFFIDGIIKAGLSPLKSEGTYFVLVPTPKDKTDIEYCTELITSKKVASIPLSPFYLKSKEGEDYVRFCFAKKKETLSAALKNL